MQTMHLVQNLIPQKTNESRKPTNQQGRKKKKKRQTLNFEYSLLTNATKIATLVSNIDLFSLHATQITKNL